MLLKEEKLPNRKPWLEELRSQLIVRPIQNDPRTRNGKLLGREISWLFNHAIGGGQANFDHPIQDLTPLDRVMLYAYLNQKAHVDELIHAFTKLLPDLDKFKNATVIDIGCGPFTAGLALANVVGNSVAFRYFGVDHSSTMCSFGKQLAESIQGLGEFNPRTQISFYQNIDEINFGPTRASEITIFVLSYLLASSSIDVSLLVEQIKTSRKNVGLGAAVLLYTNTGREGARTLYPAFSKNLIAAGFEEHIEATELFKDCDKDRLIHYALFVSPSISKIPIAEFQP
ncbi:hypothetical protein [Pseudomonas rossensis]|uniref:hypothetical protein n=1 Tax=Pseudomonas rossensis TaxID=2305471 RepID=UPI003260AA75